MGDAVSDKVVYIDWLPMEFQYCPECGPVGGEVYPVDEAGSKAGVSALWVGLGLALALALAIGGGIFALRRRGAH